jgi:hypothetical protein
MGYHGGNKHKLEAYVIGLSVKDNSLVCLCQVHNNKNRTAIYYESGYLLFFSCVLCTLHKYRKKVFFTRKKRNDPEPQELTLLLNVVLEYDPRRRYISTILHANDLF